MSNEKRNCGLHVERKPQTDWRIQPGDETFCHKCGKLLSIKWNYCTNCGEPIKKDSDVGEVELNVTLKGVDVAAEKAEALSDAIKTAKSLADDLAEAMEELSVDVDD